MKAITKHLFILIGTGLFLYTANIAYKLGQSEYQKGGEEIGSTFLVIVCAIISIFLILIGIRANAKPALSPSKQRSNMRRMVKTLNIIQKTFLYLGHLAVILAPVWLAAVLFSSTTDASGLPFILLFMVGLLFYFLSLIFIAIKYAASKT